MWDSPKVLCPKPGMSHLLLLLQENYSKARERVVSSQAGSEAKSRIDELALYLEVVGAKRRGKYMASGLRHHSFTAAQHLQPLSSPHDPDTADDTLVTPADTTTHPADTPPDTTTLDRVENRPRRFDFGPF
ncbi:hypothetical protein JCGZ_09975 [Jatropha curcas]|uniref:Uncharacterized protein n=1 Tax=Jatropha curcas TaxID=180498 RepID=A0A067KJF8_JATCU|nr:hypothetical protein JCGZ_09975 [Jatropha curcas]